MSHIGIGGIYLWGYVKRIVFPGNYSSLYLSDRKNTVEWLIIKLYDARGWLIGMASELGRHLWRIHDGVWRLIDAVFYSMRTYYVA